MKKATMILKSVSLVVAALLASPSQAAFPNLTKIYRFTGIVNLSKTGDTDRTMISCTNWKQSSAQIQIIIYNAHTGATLTGPVYTIDHKRTVTVATGASLGHTFVADHLLFMDQFAKGSMEIRATTPQVHCDVMRVYGWISAINPGYDRSVGMTFTSLHGVRYSQEGGGGIQE